MVEKLIINRHGRKNGVKGTQIIVRSPENVTRSITVHTGLSPVELVDVLNACFVDFFHSGGTWLKGGSEI